MFTIVKTLVSLCVNVGWLIPAYLSAYSVIQWCRLEASPVVYGMERQLNSFPFLTFANQTLVIAVVWLGLAIGYHTLAHSLASSKK